MSKKFLNLCVFILTIFSLSFVFSNYASAMTPTLSVSGTGDGDSVKVSVVGDPNTSVLFIYNKSGSGEQIVSIGNTNANGTFTTTLSSSYYAIPSSSLVHISLGSTNGPRSTDVSWPLVSATISSANMFSLSQTGLVLNPLQSVVISATNLGSSSMYLASNSSPMIANFSISGSQITVLANSYGSTQATFCLVSNTSNCSSVYVSVQNSNVPPLTFSQSSISLYSGQTVSVQISGGSGSYIVSNNSSQNNGIVQTNISGSNITLSTNSTTGTSSITVCSSNMTSCGIINVSMNNNVVSSAVSFSQPNPNVFVGQSLNVSIFGPTSSLFYVSSNSNPSIVQPNISGNTLSLLGIAVGTSVVNVCASASNCGSITVLVNYDNSASSAHLSLSQDNLTLLVNQTGTVTISGGAMPYKTASDSVDIFQSNLNNNILSITGLKVGSSLMSVCSFNGNCSTLSINIKNSIRSNEPLISPVNTTPSTTGLTKNTNVNFNFTKNLKNGSTGNEVSELETKLKKLGFYKGKVDGKFSLTLEKSVKSFQKKNKISQTGFVGPQTRNILNK